MPYMSMPAPKNIRTMVNILPCADKGFTSIKPTEAIVMTVIYNASRNRQPSISIYPETPHAKTNNSSISLGIVQSSFGIGGILGGVLMTIWGGTKKKIKTLLLGIMISSIGSIILGLSKSLPMLVISAMIISISSVATNASSQAIWQSKVSPSLQGRVFSARRVIAQLFGVIPMIASGPLVDHVLGPFVDYKIVLNALFGIEKGGAIAMLASISGILTIILIIIGFSIPLLMHVEDINYEEENTKLKEEETPLE